MHVMFRLSLLPGALLLAGTSFAVAESPLPDPVPPAVVGRPLDQIKPGRRIHDKAAVAKQGTRRAGGDPPAPAKVVRHPVSAPQALARGPAQDAPATPRPAKQALDDRADPHMRLAEVGKGTHFARKPLGPGAYFGDRHRSAVRKYYDAHPVSGGTASWRIGEPLPRGARPTPVPRDLLASLPELPPGHRYLQLGGEVVLMASGSKMVVDGISRNAR